MTYNIFFWKKYDFVLVSHDITTLNSFYNSVSGSWSQHHDFYHVCVSPSVSCLQFNTSDNLMQNELIVRYNTKIILEKERTEGCTDQSDRLYLCSCLFFSFHIFKCHFYFSHFFVLLDYCFLYFHSFISSASFSNCVMSFLSR